MTNGGPESLTNEDAATWIQRAAKAQGGMQNFKNAGTVSMVMVDDWPGWLMRTAASPWPQNPQKIKLEASLGSDNARITLLEGEDAGTVWGLQNWVTYASTPGQSLKFDPVDDPNMGTKFWVPTVLYFPFLTFRISEANVLRYVGDEVIDGRGYAKVFASWGSEEATDEVDQYLLYIDRETHLMRWVQYTVREFGSWVVGMMRYDDYRTVGDLKLPYRLVTVSGIDDPGPDTHEYTIESVELGVDFGPQYLVPRPELSASK
jgi:hypothetical protein